MANIPTTIVGDTSVLGEKMVAETVSLIHSSVRTRTGGYEVAQRPRGDGDGDEGDFEPPESGIRVSSIRSSTSAQESNNHATRLSHSA